MNPLRRPFGILLIAAGLTAAAGLGYLVLGVMSGNLTFLSDGSAVAAAKNDSLAVGQMAPDFELQTLDGTPVRLTDLRGKVVIINFWATWCAPCTKEMPALEKRYEEQSSNLKILAVNYAESLNDVRDFTKRIGITFDVLIDQRASVQGLYRVHGYPTSYFIDTKGKIQAVHIGEMTGQEIDRNLTRAGAGK